MKQDPKALAEQWISRLDDPAVWMITGIGQVAGTTIAYYARKDGELVAGNAPLIVECDTGRVISTGTARRLDYYLRNYRVTGDPHVEAVERVRITGLTAELTVVSAVRALYGFAGKGIKEAKEIGESVKAGVQVSVSPMHGVSCARLLEVIRDAGFLAEIVFEDQRKK